jgi:ubiquinone/menaquinone biosynthesis C-methylase UbiE
MTASPSKVQLDFDRIGELSQDRWSHNSHYHPFLLQHLSSSSDSDALDIGCGTGTFSRLLAQRFRRVLALDLSPRMIEIAKERSGQYPNIDFQVADAETCPLPADHFGCIASIATLHHLPFETMLEKMKSALKANGTLLILDLYKAESVGELATSLLAMPVSITLRLINNRQIRQSAQLRAAWAEHGRTDHYLTMTQVRQACANILPEARVKRHLLWRYSIVWKK